MMLWIEVKTNEDSNAGTETAAMNVPGGVLVRCREWDNDPESSSVSPSVTVTFVPGVVCTNEGELVGERQN